MDFTESAAAPLPFPVALSARSRIQPDQSDLSYTGIASDRRTGASEELRSVSAPRTQKTLQVGILAPMPSELRPLVRAASLQPARLGGGRIYRGRVGRANLVATTTGIGTRAAAQAAERLLDAEHVDRVIVVGIAGAVGPGVAIGDLVVPEWVIDGASGETYPPAPLADLQGRGLLETSDEFVAEPERVARLVARGVIAVDMETASVAAVCVRRNCPWSVVRAISDRAGELPGDILSLVKPDGSPDLRAAARYLLTHPARLPALLTLARDSNRAARAAAATAVRACAAL